MGQYTEGNGSVILYSSSSVSLATFCLHFDPHQGVNVGGEGVALYVVLTFSLMVSPCNYPITGHLHRQMFKCFQRLRSGNTVRP